MTRHLYVQTKPMEMHVLALSSYLQDLTSMIMQNRIVIAHYQNLYLIKAETLVCQSPSPDLIPEIWNVPKWRILGKNSFNTSLESKKIFNSRDLKCTRIKDFGQTLIQYFTMVEENFQFKRSEMHQIPGFLAKTRSILH